MNRRARERIIAMEIAKLERRRALEQAARRFAGRSDAEPRAGHSGRGLERARGRIEA